MPKTSSNANDGRLLLILLVLALCAVSGCNGHPGEKKKPYQRIRFTRSPASVISRFDDPSEVIWKLKMEALFVSKGINVSFSVSRSWKRKRISKIGLVIKVNSKESGFNYLIGKIQFLIDGKRLTLFDRVQDVTENITYITVLTNWDVINQIANGNSVECKIVTSTPVYPAGINEFQFNNELLKSIREFRKQAKVMQLATKDDLRSWYDEEIKKQSND